MKKLLWSVLAIGVLGGASADDRRPPGDPPKEVEGVKCVLDQLDKAWGLKVKAAAAKSRPANGSTEFKFTLDFTKDVPDPAEMRKAFVASGGIPQKLDNHPIVFYLFDADNVSIGKYVIMGTEGDLTGVKGDAFRIVLHIDDETLKKAKKLEARLAAPPKGKD